jgi:potassium voltage-gated channel Eag-related subfamily H protein 8
LTSVLGKTFEKILNRRLQWFLESNNILSPYQYGFRKSRSTVHALANQQSNINEAFEDKSTLYTIFFDLERAYDRVWRFHIVQKLYQYGLRGNLPITVFFKIFSQKER